MGHGRSRCRSRAVPLLEHLSWPKIVDDRRNSDIGIEPSLRIQRPGFRVLPRVEALLVAELGDELLLVGHRRKDA
jgi:hypothetical protein